MTEDQKSAPHCAHDEIGLVAVAGRLGSYRDLTDLPIPSELRLPTCLNCRRWFVNRQSAESLDVALTKAYSDALTAQVRGALRHLSERGFTQTRLASLLGLSVGYLSKLRTGKKVPSSALALQLLQWAAQPSLVEQAEHLKHGGAEKKLLRTEVFRVSRSIPVDDFRGITVGRESDAVPATRVPLVVSVDDRAEPTPRSAAVSVAELGQGT